MGALPDGVVGLRAADCAPAAFRLDLGEDGWALLECPPPGPASPAVLGGLTPGERRVAELAARGLSNPAIASRRGTAARTVANQMASVYRKLGVGSRLELDALLAAPGTAHLPGGRIRDGRPGR